jgi:putative glutathione S-transferase
MGTLIDGVWTDEGGAAPAGKDGRYQRADSRFRNWITPDGAPGPESEGGFEAEAGRYHLYVAINCPWAHRTMIVRTLKKLNDAVTLSTVLPRRTDQGWVFVEDGHQDPILGKASLHEIYTESDAHYTGRVTVPVLWDKDRGVIVNNESSEIIRILNSAFGNLGDVGVDLYPEAARPVIDEWNALIYETVNNGVYRTGFARTQEAYEEAFDALFATLDKLDSHLGKNRYIAGAQASEADWRLFPTLVRFDVAYVGAFKCNRQRIADYENLWPYARELYQVPGVAETVDTGIYKAGYYSMSKERNPLGIVPKGPVVDFTQAHGRDAFS